MKKPLLLLCGLLTLSLAGIAQWTSQNTAFSLDGSYPDDIKAVDSNVVWIVGAAGDGSGVGVQEFSRTIDGGNMWQAGTVTTDTNYRFANIMAVNQDLAWATMYKNIAAQIGHIYRTTDGGATWVPLDSNNIFMTTNLSFPNFTYFWNATHGVSMGDPASGYYEIYTTVDSGTTWTRVPSANIPQPTSGEYGLVDCYDVIDSTMWAGTNKGRMFKSVDGGQNWTVAHVGNIDAGVKVAFRDLNNGLCQKSNGATTPVYTLYKSTDGGTSWNVITPSGTMFKSDLIAIPGNNTFMSSGASSAGRGSSYSNDDGLSWYTIDTGASAVDGNGYTSLDFINTTIGWGGGFTQNAITGGISRWVGGVVATSAVPVALPALGVNPNPSNDIVRLQMMLEKKSSVAIRITDAIGRTVYSVDERAMSGQLNHVVRVQDWKAGIYFVSLEWNGNRVQQKFIVQ